MEVIMRWDIVTDVAWKLNNRDNEGQKTANIIFEEFVSRTCHSKRHPANWMIIDELSDYSLAHLTQNEINALQFTLFKFEYMYRINDYSW